MGARGNRGREGYGRRERKGWEAGVLRELEVGEKCETLNQFFLIQQCIRILSKTRTQNIFVQEVGGSDPCPPPLPTNLGCLLSQLTLLLVCCFCCC